MALTKKNKQTIRDVSTYLSVAEMAVRFGVAEKEIYSYLREIKVKPLVTSGNVDINERKKALSKIDKVSESKSDIEDKNLSILGIIKSNWKFLVLLLIGVFLIYFNSLHGDFVSDDYAAITSNPEILNIHSGMAGFLIGMSNWFLAIIFGIKSSFPFHLLSLIVYMGDCVMAFVFLSLIFDKKIAMYATVLFASLPIHVESVAWISGKPYVMSTFFVLFSLSLTILFIKTQKKSYLFWLLPILVLTFWSDRLRSSSYLFLLVLYVVSYHDELKNKINFKKIFAFGAVGLTILFLLLIPVIKYRINSVNSGYNFSDSLFYNPLYQYPTSIAKYLQLMLVPIDLTLYHTMYVIPVWLNWMIFITYLVSLVYFFFKNKNLFFALAFIFIASASSMAPVKVSWLVAERYLCLGSLGFALFMILAFKPLAEKMKYLSFILFAAIILIYCARVASRNADWSTNHNLWVNTVQVSPNSHNAWNNIGDDYDKLGQLENAVKGFTQSTIVKPKYADAYHNRANIFYKAGRLDLARDSYETALKYSPDLYQTLISLVQVDIAEKKGNLAVAHATRLTEVQFNNPQSFYILAVVYGQFGNKEEMVKNLKKSLEIYPNYKLSKDLLSQIK